VLPGYVKLQWTSNGKRRIGSPQPCSQHALYVKCLVSRQESGRARISVGAFQPMTSLAQVLGWIDLAGLTDLADFIPWTTLILGVALIVLAVFVSNAKSQTLGLATAQSKTYDSGKTKSTGSAARDLLRLGFLVAGIILLVGAIINGHQDYVRDLRSEQPRNEVRGTGRWKAKEATRYQNAPAESGGKLDRTLVRSENNISMTATSSAAFKTNTPPIPKRKFLHKGFPE
jgi:hypothetical protein